VVACSMAVQPTSTASNTVIHSLVMDCCAAVLTTTVSAGCHLNIIIDPAVVACSMAVQPTSTASNTVIHSLVMDCCAAVLTIQHCDAPLVVNFMYRCTVL